MMFWNKIEVDSLNIHLENSEPIYLEVCHKTKINIVVLENISGKVVIIGNNNYDVDVKLNANANLIVNSINKDNSVNVNISLLEKASITYNHSVLANGNSENSFNISHLANDSVSNIYNNGINRDDNKLFFTIDGIIPKNMKNIVCNQTSKIINYRLGNSKIIPNLIIDSNDIIANHSAYIGEIGEEEIFYMKSRGISDKDLKKLIYKSIMLGTMELSDEESEFNKIINEWW